MCGGGSHGASAHKISRPSENKCGGLGAGVFCEVCGCHDDDRLRPADAGAVKHDHKFYRDIIMVIA